MSVTDDVRSDPWAGEPPDDEGRGKRSGGEGPPQRGSGGGGGGNSGGGGGGEFYDRTPPQDVAAEQCVLGGMLLSKDAIADVVEIVRAHDFYRPIHTTIFEGVLDLYGRGEPADPITVAAALADSGALNRVGGAPYLHTLIASVPTAANAAYYARIVAERAVLRRLVEAGTRIVQLGYGAAAGAGRDVDDVVDLAQQAIYDVTEKRVSEDFAVLAEMLQPTLDEIEAVGSQGGVMTGVPTGFSDLDRLLNGLHAGQLIIVAGRPGLGKCLHAESLVTEATSGERMTIEAFVRRGQAGERLTVHTLTDEWKIGVAEPSDFVPSGRQPVFRLTTRSGRTVRATASHPFRRPGGWQPLDQLRVGDAIAVPRELSPVWTQLRHPSPAMGIAAYLIGEGSLAGGVARLAVTNCAVAVDAAACAARLGVRARPAGFHHCDEDDCQIPGRQERYGEPGHWHPTALTFVTPAGRANPLTEHLREVGLLTRRGVKKRIPEAYLQFGIRQLHYFLARLYAIDGWARLAGDTGVEVGYGATSEGLARDVQYLLLRCGLNADLVRVERGWHVLLREVEQVERFCREIGIIGQDETVAEVLAECERLHHHGVGEALPVEIWPLVLAEKGTLSWAQVNERCGRPGGHDWRVGEPCLTRAALYELAKALDSKRLFDLADGDVWWDPIVAIEPAGTADVYDLTVPGTHNFVADGIVVHNSTAAMDFSRAASVKHNMASAIFSLEMSKVEIVMRLLSAEARVPLHVLRSGQLSDDDWTKLARRMGEISEAPLYVDDTPNMTLMEIRAKARRLKQRHDLKLIVVDYLQLMTSPKRTESRQQEVADLSRGLKLLAKEVECPVVAVSQLNRGPEQRTDKRPQLSDLRESGCLPASTRVVRADTNAPVTLGELLADGARDVPVWALNERLQYVPSTMTHVFSSGRKPVFRIRLASGKEIDATANHKFLTLDGWQAIGDLAEGVRLAVPRHVPPPGQVRGWAEAEVVLLAHLLGEGSFPAHRPVTYASQDDANLAAVIEAADHFGVTPIRDQHTLRLLAQYGQTQQGRNPIAAWLDSLGLAGRRSDERFVPEGVFALPKAQVALFLRHLWATDGSVSVAADQRGGRINFASTSRRLVEDLALLLLRFGISSRLRTHRSLAHRPQHSLDISGRDDQMRFLREIGVHGARASAGTSLMLVLEGLRADTQVNTVPTEVWSAVRGVLTERAEPEPETGTSIERDPTPARSRQRLARLAQVLDDADLELLATNDIFWDEIRAVEPLGEMDVFDATVLGTHNFIANGIATHNSIEQDADVVILLHRDDYYDKESPRAGEADFIVAKHRNGPTDTVTVAAQLHLSRFVDMAVV